METENNNLHHDGHSQFEQALNHLLEIIIDNSNNSKLVRMIKIVIEHIEFGLKTQKFKPKLPLYQIEQEIIAMCKEDANLHGIQLLLNFKNRSENTDLGKIRKLTLNIEKS